MTMREQMVNLFKELPAILEKFSTMLIFFIAAKNIDTGPNSLFKTQHKLMMSLLLILVLYYQMLVVTTILLQLYHHNNNNNNNTHLPPILTFTTILLGSAASVLALTIISPTISFITLPLWVCFFTLMAYCYYHQQVYELMCSVCPERIKILVERAHTAIFIN